jgi:hypothetical protein
MRSFLWVAAVPVASVASAGPAGPALGQHLHKQPQPAAVACHCRRRCFQQRPRRDDHVAALHQHDYGYQHRPRHGRRRPRRHMDQIGSSRIMELLHVRSTLLPANGDGWFSSNLFLLDERAEERPRSSRG